MLDASDANAGVATWIALQIPGTEQLTLDQAYKAMRWLGEGVPGSVPGVDERHTTDIIEEELHRRRQDLFGEVSVAFRHDIAVFRGSCGQTLGQRGRSKDYRPHLKEVILGMVLDDRPFVVETGSLVLRQLGGLAGEMSAHRFLDSPPVTHGEIPRTAAHRTAAACAGRRIVVARDTTEINFSGRSPVAIGANSAPLRSRFHRVDPPSSTRRLRRRESEAGLHCQAARRRGSGRSRNGDAHLC